MYKGLKMHRTQIYFEEDMFEQIKQRASLMGVSVSAYIRDILKKELKNKKESNSNLDDFVGMWSDRDISLNDIREKAWK